MIGGTKSNKSGGSQTQTFLMNLNTKENPPVFKSVYWQDNVQGNLESSYLSDVYVRGIRCVNDEYDGQEIPKYEVQFYDNDLPEINPQGEQTENKVRHLYKIKSSFSLKGRELLNNIANAVENGNDKMSISIKQAFNKNPKTGKWNVPVTDKKGKNVYNILVFIPKEDGDGVSRVMPLLANADFCEHPLKEKYIEVENQCKELGTGKPAVKFWQSYINDTLQGKMFEMYRQKMAEQDIEVEVEDWSEYRLKHTLPNGQTDTEDKQEIDDQPSDAPDDDLPF